MLYELHAITLDTNTGLLAVDRGDGTVVVLDLAALVLDEVGQVDAALSQPRLRLGDGAANGDEGAVPADLQPAPGRFDTPDVV